MSLAVTEPLSIPQVLDKGFQLFRKVLPKVLPLTVVAGLLSATPGLLFPVHKPVNGHTVDHPGMMFGWMLLQMIVGVSIYIAVIRKVDDVAEGRNQLSLSDAYAGGFKWFPTAVGGMFLYMLAIMGGMIALLIPGIIWMMSLNFFWFFIIFENQGPLESLKSSRALVRGHWWRWTAIFSVALSIFAGLYVVMLYLAKVTGTAAAGGDYSAGLVISNAVAQIIVGSLSTPMLYSVQLIGFRDLQLRKGGADLASRIAQAA